MKNIKLKLLDNKNHCKYLIYVLRGYDTYKKLSAIRKKERGNKKFEHGPICKGLTLLRDGGIIREEGVKRKFNKLIFEVNQNAFVDLFLSYFESLKKDRILELENEKDGLIAKAIIIEKNKKTNLNSEDLRHSINEIKKERHFYQKRRFSIDECSQTFVELLMKLLTHYLTKINPDNYNCLRYNFNEFIRGMAQISNLLHDEKSFLTWSDKINVRLMGEFSEFIRQCNLIEQKPKYSLLNSLIFSQATINLFEIKT